MIFRAWGKLGKKKAKEQRREKSGRYSKTMSQTHIKTKGDKGKDARIFTAGCLPTPPGTGNQEEERHTLQEQTGVLWQLGLLGRAELGHLFKVD